jgi:putative ABC transport system ATP-binding protein
MAAGRSHQEAQKLALASLAEVGLAGHADQVVEELSGGQQQRTAVARALALQPRLLIADEPTAEQDPVTRTLVMARMLAVSDRGGGLVLATHDPDVAGQCHHTLDLQKIPSPVN